VQYVDCEQDGYVNILTICRESARNALNDDVLRDLSDALELVSPEETRCLIITGKGRKAFVAGADIGEMCSRSRVDTRSDTKRGSDLFRRLEQLAIPVIAAINGYALGGGCELALACDIRIASDNAVIGLPEVTLGIMSGYGGTQRLPRIIGQSAAKELIYTGRWIKADEALRLGLVSAVYPADDLMREARDLAHTISGNAPIAIRAAKRAINEGIQTDMDSALNIELEQCVLCFETEDQREGMTAFVQKRKPKAFVNR
jgi:enoyl-CoA hydratase